MCQVRKGSKSGKDKGRKCHSKEATLDFEPDQLCLCVFKNSDLDNKPSSYLHLQTFPNLLGLVDSPSISCHPSWFSNSLWNFSSRKTKSSDASWKLQGTICADRQWVCKLTCCTTSVGLLHPTALNQLIKYQLPPYQTVWLKAGKKNIPGSPTNLSPFVYLFCSSSKARIWVMYLKKKTCKKN